MRKSGAILAILIFFGTFALSQAAEARGFLETVFGFGQQERASQIYLAPQRPLHHRHATNAARTQRRLIAHDGRKYALKRQRFAGHQRKLHQGAAAPSESPSPQNALAISSARPCCSNAQEAINQIINNDPTLRPGDAYMSNDGLRVYVGERKKDSQFVPVEHARHIGAGLKQRLAAVSKPPTKTFARTSADDARAKNQGRIQGAELQRASAHDKPHKDNMVDGPQGRLIRFVGGFAN